MWVKLARPQFDRSCDDCRKFIYDEAGEKRTNRRTGLPLVNATGSTPCAECPKIPARVVDDDGKVIPNTPANANKLRPHAVELTPRLIQAWLHYRECRAVGSFPDDPIVRANAAEFRRAEDEAAESRQAERDARLVEMIVAATKQRSR